MPKKSLGQHWLKDPATLEEIAEGAEITSDDVVLEIGPGPGTLTQVLTERARKVIAVELDGNLAKNLAKTVPAINLTVVHEDIMRFDLTSLGPNYKVVANIPYYLTSNLLRTLCESPNPFSVAAILVQKEVAQRAAAGPGKMSVLSISVQLYCEATLGQVVRAALFTPPPKIDSQVLILKRRAKPLFPGLQTEFFFQLVKAGFAQRRKTLVNSLSGGFRLSTAQVARIVERAHIDPSTRAQNLSLEQWYQLQRAFTPLLSSLHT